VSYDLLLEGPSLDGFRALMKGAFCVQASANAADSWMFTDESTGVYFSMNVDRVTDADAIRDGAPSAPYVDCEVNYLRPSFFMDEALPLVLQYARQAELTVRDPQREDRPMPPDEIDQRAVRETWLDVTRNWSRRELETIPFLAPAASSLMFRHNISRDVAMNDPVKNPDGLFIPLILPIVRHAEPRTVLTGIVIGSAVACSIPQCDVVVLVERKRALGIAYGPFVKRLVSRESFIARLAPFLDNPAAIAPRLVPPHLSTGWAALRQLTGEAESTFDRLSSDGFVDVS
jgi:hypothetical protein